MTDNRTSKAVDDFLELYEDGFRVHDAQEYAIFRKYRRMEEALRTINGLCLGLPDRSKAKIAQDALAFDPLNP